MGLQRQQITYRRKIVCNKQYGQGSYHYSIPESSLIRLDSIYLFSTTDNRQPVVEFVYLGRYIYDNLNNIIKHVPIMPLKYFTTLVYHVAQYSELLKQLKDVHSWWVSLSCLVLIVLLMIVKTQHQETTIIFLQQWSRWTNIKTNEYKTRQFSY